MEANTLFSPEKIGNVQIPNRIVRSATFCQRAEKYGYIGEKLVTFLEELAIGGTGLIITGATAVDPSGTGGPYQPCLYDESFMPGHKKLVDTIHEYDSKIAVQILHTGRQGVHPKYPAVGPSPITDKVTGLTPRELKTEEVYKIIQKFIDAGRRAYEVGYDMVQLHGGHGYLLSNFISPYTNQRTDEFGDSIPNRVKILIDIYNGLKDKVGKSFPIMIKQQVKDFVPNGLTEDEGVEIAKLLVDTGFDAIEPSGGIGETQLLTKERYPSRIIKSVDQENYFLPVAKKLMPLMKNCKMILVGGIKNPQVAEDILLNGWTDFISLCRPLIYEPHLPNRWKTGDLSPAKCKSCNLCFEPMLKGIPIYCVVKKNLDEKEMKT